MTRHSAARAALLLPLLLAACAGPARVTAPEPAPAPIVEEASNGSAKGLARISPTRYDFGSIPQTERVETTFTVANTGTGVLRVLNIFGT